MQKHASRYPMIKVHRIGDSPIIHQGLHPSLGDNINGPSLLRIPDGTPNALARYYLYFSHHKGQHIRLAYADRVEGPWNIHPGGVMPLASSPFAQSKPDVPQPAWAVAQGTDGLYPHLASPDVFIRDDDTFEMYVHGLDDSGEQVTWRAVSRNGLNWRFTGALIQDTYLRIFHWQEETYAMARCSRFWKRTDAGWTRGHIGISEAVRHVAVLVRDDHLHVLFTRIGDAPEHLLHTSISLGRIWQNWRCDTPATPVMHAELPWEGAGQPVTTSMIGAVDFSNALRDPCLFEDAGAVWLIYAGGGEHALGLAQIDGI